MRDFAKIATLTGALMVVLSAFSAGQATTGSVSVETNSMGALVRHVVDWTASDDGFVVFEGITTTGYLRQVEILSSEDTFTSPATGYDVYVLNDMRRDILEDAGDSIDSAATGWTTGDPEVAFPILNTASTSSTNQVYGLVFGRLTLIVDDAGAADDPSIWGSQQRRGRLALYFDRYN